PCERVGLLPGELTVRVERDHRGKAQGAVERSDDREPGGDQRVRRVPPATATTAASAARAALRMNRASHREDAELDVHDRSPGRSPGGWPAGGRGGGVVSGVGWRGHWGRRRGTGHVLLADRMGGTTAATAGRTRRNREHPRETTGRTSR